MTAAVVTKWQSCDHLRLSLGLDRQRLVYRYGGRNYSLTDIHGRVVKEVLA